MPTFATLAAEEIFATFPEWRLHSRDEQAEDGSKYVFVDVPAPAEANTSHGLTINTVNEEITVSFDFYHSHFDRWNVREAGYEYEAALPFVQSLLEEVVAVASWWNEDKWAGSCQVLAGEAPLMPVVKDYSHVRVRSWHGTLNADSDA